MKKRKEYTRQEIIARLKWFHGEEFEKYPLVESFQNTLDKDIS